MVGRRSKRACPTLREIFNRQLVRLYDFRLEDPIRLARMVKTMES